MKSPRVISACFVVSVLASVALIVVYFVGDPQLEGVLLGLALGGLGLGVVLVATRVLDEGEVVEEREPLGSGEAQREETEEDIKDERITRRKALVRLGGAASGSLALALAIPALSLGPTPGTDLFRTGWVKGKRVVDANDEPVRPEDIEPGTVITVFPAGFAGEADSQAVLVKVTDAEFELDAERASWTPEGLCAYSKICTHAGCPVGLYRAESHELLCPCHQSTFDVLRGAEPTFGPADRALPQLPLAIDDEGYLVADGGFSAAVGPTFWNLKT